MRINATLINLFHICPRECWLHANGINMEHNSDTVRDGKLLHEICYSDRSEKLSELSIEAIFNGINLYGKLDYYDAKRKIIHETKRGDKVDTAHTWQVKFYLWVLSLNGIQNASAVIEYPLLRQTERVELTNSDKEALAETVMRVSELQNADVCPPVLHAKICKSCSYYDLCYIGEE